MELGAGVAKALLASAKGTEVLSGPGRDIFVQVEVDTAGLICDKVRHGSDAMRPAALEDLVQWQKWGSNGVLPLTSLVARELASRTGPCQETSKKTLMVIFAGDIEKFLVDGVEK